MAVGILNPSDNVRATSTRPTATASAAAARRWYSESLHTIIKADDLNNILAQIRTVLDFYSIPDVEGDDTLLRQAIGAAALSLTGNIGALQGLTGAANKGFYFTAPATMALYDLSSYSRTLLSQTTLTAWQTALGVSAGSAPNVIALGGLAGGANQLPYFTGVGSMAQTSFTSQARDLLDDTSFSGMRTTLGLASGATADISLYAPLASPGLTGTPTAPTATPGTNTTQIATTAFVTVADALKANLASPAFTGTPTAPTASAGTSTTQVATTAFVAVSYAPLSSPALTGNPTAPTQAAGNSSTRLATTAYVDTADALDVAVGRLPASLAAIYPLTPAVDRLPYYTSATVAALTPFTSFARTLLDDADALTARGTLGLGALATKTTIVNVDIDAAAAIGYTKLADLNEARFLGRALGAGTGPPTGMIASTAKLLLDMTTADVAGLDAALALKAPLTGAVFVNNIIVERATAGPAIVYIDTLAGEGAFTYYRTAGSLRWVIGKGAGAESGSNAGSDFTFNAYSDAGTVLGNVLTVPRATRVVDFMLTPSIGGAALHAHVTRQIINSDVDASASIAYSKLASMATDRLIGNVSGVSNTATAITAAQVKTMLGITTADVSGLGGLATKTTIVNADVDAAAAIAWSKINSALAIVNADVSATAAIGLGKLAVINTDRLVGNVSGSNASPAGLTLAQVKTFLALTTADVSGYGTFSSVANSFFLGTFSATGATTGIRNALVSSQSALDFSATVSTTVQMIRFYNPGGQAGRIEALNLTVSLVSGSDSRLKTSRRPLADELDIGAAIDALQPIAFDWISGGRGRGLVAQDVQAILPGIVSPGSTGDNPGDETFTPWGIDYAGLNIYLLAEVKALRSRVAALEGGHALDQNPP